MKSMIYEVVLSEKAEIHLENIYNWVKLNYPTNAKTVKDKLVNSMFSLEKFPNRGTPYRNTNYRFLVSGKFKIVYTVDKNKVIIMAIE